MASADVGVPCELQRADAAQWAEEALKNAGTVVLGRVFSMRAAPPDPQIETEPIGTDGATSMDDLLKQIQIGQARDANAFAKVVSFEVIRDWKEPPYPVVRLKMRGSRSFRVGDVYLIAGRDLEDNLYSNVNYCRDLIPVDSGTQYIQALDQLASGQ